MARVALLPYSFEAHLERDETILTYLSKSAADPRIDSDMDHRGTGTTAGTAGYGNTGGTTGFGTTGNGMTGAGTGAVGSTNAGPHSSNLANKMVSPLEITLASAFQKRTVTDFFSGSPCGLRVSLWISRLPFESIFDMPWT